MTFFDLTFYTFVLVNISWLLVMIYQIVKKKVMSIWAIIMPIIIATLIWLGFYIGNFVVEDHSNISLKFKEQVDLVLRLLSTLSLIGVGSSIFYQIRQLKKQAEDKIPVSYTHLTLPTTPYV